MTATFYIKKGDTEPKLRATLQNADGTAIDLTTATGLSFVMKAPNGTSTKTAASFVNRATGVVEYAWMPADTAAAGAYNCEFEISWAGRLQTVPSNEYIVVRIVDDLG